MNKDTIMESMEHIDMQLIEEADRKVIIPRFGIKKGLLVAACICLLLLTIAFATKHRSTAPEVEYNKNTPHVVTGELGDSVHPILKEDGVSASTKIPLSSFNETLLADVANKAEDEAVLYYYFDAWSELEEYIGFNLLDNPVLDAADPRKLSVTTPKGTLETHGYMFCTEMEDIMTCARAFAIYRMNPTEVPSGYPGINNTVHVTVRVEAAVYTEHSPIPEEDMFHSITYPLGTDFTDELYVSPNGCEFRIVRVEQHDSHGDAVNYYGIVCLNNVYIMVSATFYPDETVALATLKEILDAFVIK